MANWTREQLEMMAAIIAGSHDRTDPKYQPPSIGPDVVFPGSIGLAPSERIVRSIAVGPNGIPTPPVPERLMPSAPEGSFAGFEGITPAAVNRIGVGLSNEVDATGRRVTAQQRFAQAYVPLPRPRPEFSALVPLPMPRSMRPADPGLNGNPSFQFGTPGLPAGLPAQVPPTRALPPMPRPRPMMPPMVTVSGAAPRAMPPMPLPRPMGMPVQQFQAQGLSPQQAYAAANQAAQERAIANSRDPERNAARASLAARWGFD